MKIAVLLARPMRFDVGYVAGIGAMATYSKLLRDTQAKCAGKLEVIEAEK